MHRELSACGTAVHGAGELLHTDTKRFGRIQGLGHRIAGDRSTHNVNRGIGWDVVHVAIDDHSGVSFVLTKPDERPHGCAEFLGSCARPVVDLRGKGLVAASSGTARVRIAQQRCSQKHPDSATCVLCRSARFRG